MCIFDAADAVLLVLVCVSVCFCCYPRCLDEFLLSNYIDATIFLFFLDFFPCVCLNCSAFHTHLTRRYTYPLPCFGSSVLCPSACAGHTWTQPMTTSTANVSLTPTTASGLLCNSSPLANAIAVATTEADVRALANVVRGQHTPLPVASWATEMYGPPQPPSVAVAALHPKRSSVSSTAVASAAPSPMVNDAPFSSSGPSSASDAQPHTPPPPPPQSRMSVMRGGSAVEGDGGHSSLAADAASGQPFAATGAVASATASRLRKSVSWQCGLCGYYVLAMDQNGTPLPFTTSAFGNVLPLLCPRCKLSHTSWQPSTPFNEQGDHLNLPTTYSNRYITSSGSTAAAERVPLATDSAGLNDVKDTAAAADASDASRLTRSATGSNALLSQRAAVASLTYVAQQRVAQFRHNAQDGNRNAASTAAAPLLQRRAYYCGHCNRRLLRMDANGELVDMDRNADGSIRPIRCPGCGELHGDWVVKPYAEHP